jgi:hypothetical protein
MDTSLHSVPPWNGLHRTLIHTKIYVCSGGFNIKPVLTYSCNQTVLIVIFWNLSFQSLFIRESNFFYRFHAIINFFFKLIRNFHIIVGMIIARATY